jgi:inositol-phosphate phosphatase / L-galactose 1-phosphate phosphatase / histidinol-phosphatase
MMTIDLAPGASSAGELVGFSNELADAARPIALRYFRSRVGFEQKEDLSPVTIADRAIEEELRCRIAARYPGHGILGEETGQTPGERYTWYLDPIDGTKSFISGMPLFGTLIAVADGDRATLGVIDMPALGERWVGSSRGAFFNDRPARVSSVTRLVDAQIYTSSPDFFQPDEWSRYDALSRRCLFRRFGGDCYQYGLLASGHCDLVVETSLKTFDFMALIAVVEGAGGLIRDWDGHPLTPKSDGRVVAAATPALMAHALDALQ